MTLSHIYEPLIKTFFPIWQRSPITEFNTLQCSPMFVTLLTTEFAPICAECDNVTSAALYIPCL
uniref:eIF4-gamma/eIF5/eIF2-epsilon domain-containing protein n=1 Tax=Arundo donax TaxID=35708 RepID=A0A0A9EN49_ARUDO